MGRRGMLRGRSSGGMEGIASYWNLDGNSDDQIGSNDGTDTSITYVSGGVIDDCGNWQGSSSKIDIGSDSSLSFSSAFTYCFWVSWDVIETTELISKYETVDSGNGVGVEYRINAVGSTITATLFGQDDNSIYLRTTAPISRSINTWYHVCVTWSGGTAHLKVYVDGSLGTQTQTSLGSFSSMTETTCKSLFGKFRLGGTSISLNGQMDEIYLFNRELTPTEAEFCYNEGVAGRTLI